MMIFLNLAYKKGKVTKESAAVFTRILAPFAPHVSEELWSLLGNTGTISYVPWPQVNEEYLKESLFEYPVSFNGKMRFKISLPVDMDKEQIARIVLADERAKKWLEIGTMANIIVVPNRIVNIVIKG
jgi:leucyl-tRNA synthetase